MTISEYYNSPLFISLYDTFTLITFVWFQVFQAVLQSPPE